MQILGPPLPIDPLLPEVRRTLACSQALVLTAPPGAGKTTRVPPALLEKDCGIRGQILVLEPRRLAARACAAQISRLLGEPLGNTVGYQVRFERLASAHTCILVVTEGILTRRFLSDPLLEGVGAVVLDEFHERSVHTDLALAFLRELQEVREDLKVVVMSATLDTQPVATFMGGCPVLTCQERPFPVEIQYLSAPDHRPLPLRVASGIRSLLQSDKDQGDLLAFLPGAPEIRRTMALLEQPLPNGLQVVPLYGALPSAEQDRALCPGEKRRVILATNIAETSLTVPGVTAVLDSGLVKLVRHDPRTGIDRLETVRISQHNATQRAGRAGRLAPGRVLRLWTRADQAGLVSAEEPEIRRIDLAATLLQVISFHPGDPGAFRFFDAPPKATLDAAVNLLRLLGGLPPDGFALTAKGRRLARLPIHPRLGCILEQGAKERELPLAALLAALLAERDILPENPRVPPAPVFTVDSDLARRLELFEEVERAGGTADAAHRAGIVRSAVRLVGKARMQILKQARSLWPGTGGKSGNNAGPALGRLLLAGYPDRVCRRREPGSSDGLMVGGRGVQLSAGSGVRDAELFLALDADAGRRGARSASLVRKASTIDETALSVVFPKLLCTVEGAVFDPERRAAIGVRRRLFQDLVLQEQTGVRVRPEVLAEILAREAAAAFSEVFHPADDARQIQARILLAARLLPEEAWPAVSDEALKSWLPEVCRGRQSFLELMRVDWKAELEKRLPVALRRLLDREFPERLAVPSGSRIALDYLPANLPGGSPVLAVRLQEVFGLADTPRIGRGRVALLLHLLAPNHRPVQVTADLRSFWNQGYPEVRKQLRARYPKHSWPENPWSGVPVARPGRKGKKR